MKNISIIVLIFSFSLVFLIGCSSDSNDSGSTENPPSELQCGYDISQDEVSIDACNKSCINDDDCQPFVGSCISTNEKPYFPETLSVAFEEVDCSCENKVCVGTPTGELAI